MVVIRRATEADAIHISLLGRITYTESHGDYIENKKDLLEFYNIHYSVSQIRKELNDTENIFWIVFSDELPIGFAKLSLNITNPKLDDNKSCKLQRIYILNDFIALKIGSKLQDVILEKALELKYTNIWLTVYYKNTKGIHFYQKYGFKEVGNVNFIVGKTNYENLILSKKL